MRILCRIIGGSHTIKSYSKLTPSFDVCGIEAFSDKIYNCNIHRVLIYDVN